MNRKHFQILITQETLIIAFLNRQRNQYSYSARQVDWLETERWLPAFMFIFKASVMEDTWTQAGSTFFILPVAKLAGFGHTPLEVIPNNPSWLSWIHYQAQPRD